MRPSSILVTVGSVALSSATPAVAEDDGAQGYDPDYRDYSADETAAGDYRHEGNGAARSRIEEHRTERAPGVYQFEASRVEADRFEDSPARDSRAGDTRAVDRFGSGAWQFRAGGTYRRLYDIPVYAGELGAAVGAWDREDGDYFSLDFILPGWTENGLSVAGVSAGYRADWRISRTRVGFNVGLQTWRIQRVTDDRAITGTGLALSAFIGYDVLRTSGSAWSIDGALNLDPFIGNDSVLLWGPTVGLSCRL
jgi:hypothetical protein